MIARSARISCKRIYHYTHSPALTSYPIVMISAGGTTLPFGLGAPVAIPLHHNFVDSSSATFSHFLLFVGVVGWHGKLRCLAGTDACANT